MKGIQSLNPHSKAFLDMTNLQEMALKYDKQVTAWCTKFLKQNGCWPGKQKKDLSTHCSS